MENPRGGKRSAARRVTPARIQGGKIRGSSRGREATMALSIYTPAVAPPRERDVESAEVL